MFPVLIFLGLIQPEQPAYFLPKNWTKTQPVLVGWSLSSLSYPVGHESHNKLWNFGTFYQKTYVNHLFSYTMAPITNCSLTGGCTADFSELKSSGWGSLMFRMLCHSLVSNPVLSVKLWRKLVGKMAISFVVPRPSNSWTYSIIYIIYIILFCLDNWQPSPPALQDPYALRFKEWLRAELDAPSAPLRLVEATW